MVGSQPRRFRNQSYKKLKKRSIGKGVLFEDPFFPITDESLQISQRSLPGAIVWKRPQDIINNPRFVADGISRLSATQGVLGNCWFVAAISALASEKQLWNKVVPNYEEQEQNMSNPQHHVGIYHFCFWHFGKWIDVVVDDRLPTINGRLIFTHSKVPNEFWCALLEKAYAKLCGSYHSLESGNLVDALVDFTGGFAEVIDLLEEYAETDKQKELFKQMRKELDSHSLMCCAIKALTPEEMESRTSKGLIKGHAYCVTAARKIPLAGTSLLSFFKGRERLNMIRLRNPWGEKEWTGPFGDGIWCYSLSHLNRLLSSSPQWKKVSESERKKLGLTFDEDGEFWMTFEDFCENFTTLSTCHVLQTSWFSFGKRWVESQAYGAWTIANVPINNRAGGCPNHPSFLQNPQFRFDVSRSDLAMIMLQQSDPRQRRKEGAMTLSIGFQVLKVEVNREYRVHITKIDVSTSDYIQSRNIFHKCTLPQGRYVIVPTTFTPGQEGTFVLRMFTSHQARLRELTLNAPRRPFLPFFSYPQSVTCIELKGAHDLKTLTPNKGTELYCTMQWGSWKLASHVEDSSNPKWNTSALFYKKKLSSPLCFEVWSKGLIRDTFVGQVKYHTTLGVSTILKELPLYNRKLSDEPVGTLVFNVFTTDDFMKV